MVPHILEYGHSFFSCCISRIVTNRTTLNERHHKCPVCNHPCMREGINDFKKNFSLLEEIEKRKNQPNDIMSEGGFLYAFNSHNCIEHHPGQSMKKNNLDSIRLIGMASMISSRLDTETEKISKKLEIIDRTRRHVLMEKKAANRALKKLIDEIHTNISHIERAIEEDIEKKFENTFKQIKDLEEKFRADILDAEAKKEYMMKQVMPIQNGSIQMTVEAEISIKSSLIALESDLIPYLQSLPDKLQFTRSRFNFDGEDIIYNRVYSAVIDSWKITSRGVVMSLTPTARGLSLDRHSFYHRGH